MPQYNTDSKLFNFLTYLCSQNIMHELHMPLKCNKYLKYYLF